MTDSVSLTTHVLNDLYPRDVSTFVEARDRAMGAHKPGAIILVVKALARAELKIEIEAIAAKVDEVMHG